MSVEMVEVSQQHNYPTVEGTRARVQELQRPFEETPMQEGRMAVICPVFDADELIVPTVAEMIGHIEESQLDGADIILVMNAGGGSTFKARPALEAMGVPVYYPREESPFLEQHGGTRIIVVDQPGHRGKYYALDYIYDRIMRDRTYNPEWTLLVDAETRLRSKNGTGSVLDRLLMQAVGVQGPVGGESQIVFFDSGQPCGIAVADPVIRFKNYIARKTSSQYLDGGCIVGRSSTLIPLSKAGLEIIPGNPAEDFMLEKVCEGLGIPFATNHDVVFTNRTPRDTEARERQITRWMLAPQKIMERLGPEFSMPRSLGEKVRTIITRSFGDLDDVLNYVQLYANARLRIKKIVRTEEDTYQLTAAWTHSTADAN